MAEKMALQNEQKREGLVVWDQRGVVVAWGDGQSSRFSWETLRHLSLCTDCREQNPRQPAASSSNHQSI
ncbi:MAG: DUF971 domain-containing protein [Deltaproteobacteria bacterium]|nr:DUF971 domain-containing protein [Deltaproteobacteria bacterium]